MYLEFTILAFNLKAAAKSFLASAWASLSLALYASSIALYFSTGQWLELVNKKILELKGRKKVAILVGGTGLYFKALTDGLVNIPNIPVKFWDKIRNLH